MPKNEFDKSANCFSGLIWCGCTDEKISLLKGFLNINHILCRNGFYDSFCDGVALQGDAAVTIHEFFRNRGPTFWRLTP